MMIRPFRIAKLGLVFLREFALSVFRVAKLVLSPSLAMTMLSSSRSTGNSMTMTRSSE